MKICKQIQPAADRYSSMTLSGGSSSQIVATACKLTSYGTNHMHLQKLMPKYMQETLEAVILHECCLKYLLSQEGMNPITPPIYHAHQHILSDIFYVA